MIVFVWILAALVVLCFAGLIQSILNNETEKHETQKWVHKFEIEQERNDELRAQMTRAEAEKQFWFKKYESFVEELQNKLIWQEELERQNRNSKSWYYTICIAGCEILQTGVHSALGYVPRLGLN